MILCQFLIKEPFIKQLCIKQRIQNSILISNSCQQKIIGFILFIMMLLSLRLVKLIVLISRIFLPINICLDSYNISLKMLAKRHILNLASHSFIDKIYKPFSKF